MLQEELPVKAVLKSSFLLACSRLRDSGESVNRSHFSRSHASYFRVPFLIFVPSQLSESLEQATFLRKISQLHCFLSGPHCVFAFMFSLVGFHLLTNNCKIEMYCTLGADKLRRICTPISSNVRVFSGIRIKTQNNSRVEK